MSSSVSQRRRGVIVAVAGAAIVAALGAPRRTQHILAGTGPSSSPPFLWPVGARLCWSVRVGGDPDRQH